MAFNGETIMDYMADLRASNGDIKLAVFWDNLAAHKSAKVQKAMAELGILAIYSAPYSPNDNPIECIFSILKRRYKCLRLQASSAETMADKERLVRKAVGLVNQRTI